MIRFAPTAARGRPPRRASFATGPLAAAAAATRRAPTVASIIASLIASLAVATLAGGCGPEGGIVLEIHLGPGADSEIARLEVRVGVGHDLGGSRAIDDSWWLAAPIADGRGVVALPDGLGATTYRYKLEASDSLSRDQPLVVAVIGYGADPSSPPILFGHTSDDGIRFADGEARLVDVTLETFSSARHGVGRAGCVWWTDDPARTASVSTHDHAIVPDADSDCDGYAEGHDENGACQLDCNDLDPAISPRSQEVCEDGIDQNCCAFDRDGAADLDGDGVNGCSPTPDCVDMPRGTVVAVDVFGQPVHSEDIHPGAREVCDAIDNDCQGGCDDDPSLDGDGDGWLDCKSEDSAVVKGVHRKPDGRCVAAPLDCADSGFVRTVPASEINPGAADDQCDQIDNDCSGSCDEAKVAAGDGDGDGFAACGTTGEVEDEVPVCRLGRASDCDDGDPLGRPGVFERCDGFDTDCDGVLFTDTLPCFRLDGSQRCTLGTRACTDGTGLPMPVGACMPDLNATPVFLPASFCAPTCDWDDLASCTNGDGPVCDVELHGGPTPAPLTACLPADIPLASDPDPTCRWQLVGGALQGDWKVTLQRGATSGTSFETCGLPAVSLRVLGATPAADDRTVLILNATRVQLVTLRRREVNVCEAGVSCH
jgi:hypothetical protein